MTNFILLSLFGCLVTVSSNKISYFHGRYLSLTSTTETPETEFCDREYSCLNCTTARVCAPVAGGQSLKEMSRYSCTGTNPWCDPNTGSCTSDEANSGCDTGVLVSNFTCMRNGYFPDFTDCSKYYHCIEDVPYMHRCLGELPYYSPYYQACTSYEYQCANAYDSSCSGKTGTKVALNYVSNMFMDCVDGQPISVDRCIGAYVFDSNSQSCLPYCPHAGLFPSKEDCTQYYRCSLESSAPSDTSLVMTLNLTCPEGQGFLEEEFQCVDKSKVPNCLVKYPALFN